MLQNGGEQYYKVFVDNIITMDTPPLSDIVTARQQFIDECDENVLQNQLIRALTPFIDMVEDKDVPWWGLIMCDLFEIHIATQQLEVCECEKQ